MNSVISKTIRGGKRFFGHYTFKDVECVGCSFVDANFGYNGNWKKNVRDSLSDVLVQDADIHGCMVGPAIIRRAAFSNIRGDLLICWGTLFDRVKVLGRFDALMINGFPEPGMTGEEKKKYIEKREIFYGDVDWALDISRAEFSDFCIRSEAIPLSKIKLDPLSQFVIDVSGDVVGVDGLPVSSYTKILISQMYKERASRSLLVAPKLDQNLFQVILRDAGILKDAGYIK